MRYFVIWPDGQRFGPADAEELVTWLKEGRITLDMEAEIETTGEKLQIGRIPRLREVAGEMNVNQPKTGWEAPPSAGYYRPGMPMPGAPPPPGNSDVQLSWVLSGLGLGLSAMSLCCCNYITALWIILPIFGLVNANKALMRNVPGAGSARIFAIVVIVLVGLLGLASIMLLIYIFSNPGFQRSMFRSFQ